MFPYANEIAAEATDCGYQPQECGESIKVGVKTSTSRMASLQIYINTVRIFSILDFSSNGAFNERHR